MAESAKGKLRLLVKRPRQQLVAERTAKAEEAEAEMRCKGGEEGGNGPVLGQTVQARLPPFPARKPAGNQ